MYGTYHLELYNGKININQTLINENLAVYKEESLQSKVILSYYYVFNI